MLQQGLHDATFRALLAKLVAKLVVKQRSILARGACLVNGEIKAKAGAKRP